MTDTQSTSLHEERLDRVAAMLLASGARDLLDLGCGSGSLLHRLLSRGQWQRVVGLEWSGVSLAQARTNLAPWLESGPLELIRGSYTDPNPALGGFEAAAMVETIEHVEPGQLSRVERAVFGQYRPALLLMTTPNREYNPLFDLAPGEFRDPDHRFEWDRDQFRRWGFGVARRNGYRVRFSGIGDADPELGPPTQVARFERLL